MDRPRKQPRVGRLARFARGRRFDRNPLRRASDRAETVMLIAALIAFAVGAPLAAGAGGGLVRGVAQRNMTAQQASRYQVEATLTAAAARSRPADAVEAAARWTAPDGRGVTADIPVPAGTLTGAREPIWVTRDGQLSTAPLQPWQVAEQAELAGLIVVLGLALVLAGAGLVARRALDKHRIAAWGAEWQANGAPGMPRA